MVDVRSFDGTTVTYRPKHVIIATGSVPIELPYLPFDEERILSNVGALRIPEVPKHLIVIGGGVIGLELGSVWRRLGAMVTVLEFAPTILPGCDHDITKEADPHLRASRGSSSTRGPRSPGGHRDGARVVIGTEQNGAARTFGADYVLVAIGRRPALTGIDPHGARPRARRRGARSWWTTRCAPTCPNVFAIGDAVGGKLLAHKAEEEGVIAAEVIAGQKAHMHYHNMPSVVYTWPEVACAASRRPR